MRAVKLLREIMEVVNSIHMVICSNSQIRSHLELKVTRCPTLLSQLYLSLALSKYKKANLRKNIVILMMQSKQNSMFPLPVYTKVIMTKLLCLLNRICQYIKWRGILSNLQHYRTTFYEDLIKKTKNRAPPVGTYNHKGMNPAEIHGIYKRYSVFLRLSV